jgi:hypothetical protein
MVRLAVDRGVLGVELTSASLQERGSVAERRLERFRLRAGGAAALVRPVWREAWLTAPRHWRV